MRTPKTIFFSAVSALFCLLIITREVICKNSFIYINNRKIIALVALSGKGHPSPNKKLGSPGRLEITSAETPISKISDLSFRKVNHIVYSHIRSNKSCCF